MYIGEFIGSMHVQVEWVYVVMSWVGTLVFVNLVSVTQVHIFLLMDTAQRCILPLSFPLDLFAGIIVNPPERKLAKHTYVHWLNNTVDRRIFLPFWSQDFKNYDAIYSRSKSSDKLSEEYLCLAKKSKLLFWRRRLCVRPSVRLSECLSVFLQTRKFGEQTSRILEFKPEGLEG